MSERVVIVAPTDAQLAYIASLCEERGLPPAVVYSKADASATIGELLNRTYRPPEWDEDAKYDGPDYRADDERARYEDNGYSEVPF